MAMLNNQMVIIGFIMVSWVLYVPSIGIYHELPYMIYRSKLLSLGYDIIYHGIPQTRPFNEDDQVMVALLSPRVHPWMRRLSLNRFEREEMVSDQKNVFFSYSLRMFMKRILLFF